jgi:hypothetical protein
VCKFERERKEEEEEELGKSPVNNDTICSFVVDINISPIAFVDMKCWAREPAVYSKHCLVGTKPFEKCLPQLKPKGIILTGGEIICNNQIRTQTRN